MTHNNPKKIAVVAVHGVSDQKPFESARAIANLLLDPTTNNRDNYRFFNERFFRIRVRLNASQNETEDNICDRLQKQLNQLENQNFEDVNLDFTRDRLDKYDKSTVYDSVCLEGECTTSKGETKTKKVDIYEMHWADLSRLGTGFVQIFGELFQLLFHLSSLGRPIIDSTRSPVFPKEQFYPNSNNKFPCIYK